MKNTKKKVAKKVVAKKVAKKVVEKKVAVPQTEFYRADMEVPQVNLKTGVTEYAYTDGPAQEEVKARDSMEQLKAMGVGGRLIKLDGSPDGEVVERWGGVGRVLEASTVEKDALEQGKK